MSDFAPLPDLASPLSAAATEAASTGGDEHTTTLPPGKTRKVLKFLGWSIFALLAMFFFTVIKLPEERVRNFIHGNIAAALAPQGIAFSATEGKLRLGLGLSYVMKDVTLVFPTGDTARVEEISISPSLLPLLIGKRSGRAELRHGNGNLTARFSMRGNVLDASYRIQDLDIGKIGMSAIAGFKGGAIASGEGNINGDLLAPPTMLGDLKLDLKSIGVDAQNIMGFSIPKVSISGAKMDVAIDKGKAQIKILRIGQAGAASTDDIRANLTGDVSLGKQWPQSALNIRVEFSLSPNVMKSFSLLDALLGPGKQPDGSYVYKLGGTFASPVPTPVPPGSR